MPRERGALCCATPLRGYAPCAHRVKAAIFAIRLMLQRKMRMRAMLMR